MCFDYNYRIDPCAKHGQVMTEMPGAKIFENLLNQNFDENLPRISDSVNSNDSYQSEVSLEVGLQTHKVLLNFEFNLILVDQFRTVSTFHREH